MKTVVSFLLTLVVLCSGSQVLAGFGDVVFQFSGPVGTCAGVCYDGSYVNVIDATANIIYKYEPSTGVLSGALVLGVGWWPGGLGWDGTYYWMGENFTETIKKIHPISGIEVDFITAPAPTNRNVLGVACAGVYVWSTNQSSPSAGYKQDSSDGTILVSFSAPGPEASGMAFDGTNLWMADTDRDSIYMVSQTGVVGAAFAAPGPEPAGLAFDGEFLWNADAMTHEVYKIDVSNPGISESYSSAVSLLEARIKVVPNPARSVALIELTCPEVDAGPPMVKIYDATGRIVTSAREQSRCGTNTVLFRWDGRDSRGNPAPAGVYFVEADIGKIALFEVFALTK